MRILFITSCVFATLNIVSTIVVCYFLFAQNKTFFELQKISQSDTVAKFDSIATAGMMGRLDLIAVSLAIIGVVFAVLAIGGFWIFRHEAVSAANATAEQMTPGIVTQYMNDKSSALVGEALSDPQVVAELQRRFVQLRIDDAEDAESIDADLRWTP